MEEHEESTYSAAPEAAPGAPSATGEATASAPPPTVASPAAPRLPKRPAVAALLALFPGIGHVYCGLYSRALMFFAAFIASIQMIDAAETPIFGMAMVFFWSFGVVDAYRQATLINLGDAADLGLERVPRVGKPGQEILATGIVLFSLGFLELLSRLRLWDWELLMDHAYILLMVIGGWLIVHVLLRRRKESREDFLPAMPEA